MMDDDCNCTRKLLPLCTAMYRSTVQVYRCTPLNGTGLKNIWKNSGRPVSSRQFWHHIHQCHLPSSTHGHLFDVESAWQMPTYLSPRPLQQHEKGAFTVTATNCESLCLLPYLSLFEVIETTELLALPSITSFHLQSITCSIAYSREPVHWPTELKSHCVNVIYCWPVIFVIIAAQRR